MMTLHGTGLIQAAVAEQPRALLIRFKCMVRNRFVSLHATPKRFRLVCRRLLTCLSQPKACGYSFRNIFGYAGAGVNQVELRPASWGPSDCPSSLTFNVCCIVKVRVDLLDPTRACLVLCKSRAKSTRPMR